MPVPRTTANQTEYTRTVPAAARERSRIRLRCGLCGDYRPHLIQRRHTSTPVEYDLRCARCGWVWRSKAPTNFWRWVKTRYQLSPAEHRRAQKLAFFRVFGADESYQVVSFERLRGVGVYGLGIKLQVVKYLESELRPLSEHLARERRRETLLQLRELQRAMPRWR